MLLTYLETRSRHLIDRVCEGESKRRANREEWDRQTHRHIENVSFGKRPRINKLFDVVIYKCIDRFCRVYICVFHSVTTAMYLCVSDFLREKMMKSVRLWLYSLCILYTYISAICKYIVIYIICVWMRCCDFPCRED